MLVKLKRRLSNFRFGLGFSKRRCSCTDDESGALNILKGFNYLIEPLWSYQLLCTHYLSSTLKLSLHRAAWDVKWVGACKWLRNSWGYYVRLRVVEDTDLPKFMNDGPSGGLWQGCHHVPFMLSAACSLFEVVSSKTESLPSSQSLNESCNWGPTCAVWIHQL